MYYFILKITFDISGPDVIFLARPICITILMGELRGLKPHTGMLKCDWLILDGQNLIVQGVL